MTWQPDITVAAICERDGRFLLVEERSKSSGQIVLNQPAGHLEDGESILDAVKRETLEETGCVFSPKALVGMYRLRLNSQKTYIRYTFCGTASNPLEGHTLDPDIIQTHWLTLEQIKQCDNLRSPLVLQCINDYLSGQRFPLAILRD